MSKIRAAITGVSGYVPDYILTNEELSQMVDTSDEWITSRTGIKERRILKGKNKGASAMAIEAVKKLLHKTGTDPQEVDMLLCATVTPDYTFPATANIVSAALGLRQVLSYDINAACSGFIFALATAAQFVETGAYKKVVVVGVDKMSSIIDYSDRTTCVIFGDGAGAVLLEPDQEGYGLLDFKLHSDGTGCKYLHKKAGGSAFPVTIRNFLENQHYVYQEGQAVFKFAVVNMAEVCYEVMQRNGLKAEDVHWLVPHQANKRIIDAAAERMGLPEERVMLNIQKYGNTTAGTIPLCLNDYEQALRRGDNLILAAFGGGFTWGALYLKWKYDGHRS
ncbi:MAG: ketoacyl-ACP synthase III [Flavobacteriales bacterium]|nr:ketoacyl-ACP synthase III [Flavobacteriales bacterium]MCX7651037.1 ketoacyl-ACP synthase III [Flavobacteriales bacterium]MDW8431841.1 beta-ketoacyl-ACP synthase III [Flavobacteriales bacterium]